MTQISTLWNYHSSQIFTRRLTLIVSGGPLRSMHLTTSLASLLVHIRIEAPKNILASVHNGFITSLFTLPPFSVDASSHRGSSWLRLQRKTVEVTITVALISLSMNDQEELRVYTITLSRRCQCWVLCASCVQV